MKKYTPQEWADITGCYVARDEGRACFYIYEVKPVRNYERNWWNNPGGDYGELPTSAVPEEYYSDDWSILYEPHNKSEGCYTDQADSDNKDSANSCEVSKNQYKPEYHTITAHAEIGMEEFAKGVMAWIERGWKPSGGISFDKKGCPHQVVVRGV